MIIPEDIAQKEIEHCIGELERHWQDDGLRDASAGQRTAGSSRSNLPPSPLKDDGEITGYASIMRDISDRKRLEEACIESEANLRTIFNSTRDAIIIHDLEGRILDVNEQDAGAVRARAMKRR